MAHNEAPPDEEEYEPEKWLEEQEKSRQNPRDSKSRSNSRGGDGKDSKKSKSKPGGKARDGKAADSKDQSKAAPPAEGQWVLVLRTFTEGDHASAAERMVKESLPKVAPQLRGAFVHTTAKGSLVVYGRYAGRDDPQAEKDQEWIKSIKQGSQPVFRRVMLTHIDLRSDGQLHPHDLLSARKAHLNVDPLYTLDVALWDDFGAGKMKFDEIKSKAEAQAASLRRQGHEAYFHHDLTNERSIVTVGLFDRRAIDPKSGLFSFEVEQLMKKFPVRLVNGEELHEYVDKYNPKRGTKPQTPKLVVVPAP